MGHFCLNLFVLGLALQASVANANPLSDIVADYENVWSKGVATHIVEIDNDTLLLDQDDGFYTSGLRYTYLRSLQVDGGLASFGWRVGQELYTPSDIKLPPEFIGPPNHPYAGWLYAGVLKEAHRSDGTYTKVGIDIGCLGPCAGGEWTQTQFHKVLNQPLPRGWNKQIRSEVGVVLHGETAPIRWAPSRSFDFTPAFSARLGNVFTDAGASLLARAGQLNVLPSSPAFYAYVRAEVRTVGRNGTLQGGYFRNDNPHTVDPKRITGNAEAGVIWRRGAYSANLALVRRSNEIKDLPNSIGAQNYLHLQFSYTP